MSFVAEPIATAEYDAIAAALRPHATGGRVDMSLAHVVGLAASAVLPTFQVFRDELAARRGEYKAMEVEARARVNKAVQSLADLRRSTDEALALMEVAVLRAEAEARGDPLRIAALEAVAVQAQARYANDRHAKPLRDALAAAGYH